MVAPQDNLLKIADRIERSAHLAPSGEEPGAMQQQQRWRNVSKEEAVPFLAIELGDQGLQTTIEFAECSHRMSTVPGARRATTHALRLLLPRSSTAPRAPRAPALTVRLFSPPRSQWPCSSASALPSRSSGLRA